MLYVTLAVNVVKLVTVLRHHPYSFCPLLESHEPDRRMRKKSSKPDSVNPL